MIVDTNVILGADARRAASDSACLGGGAASRAALHNLRQSVRNPLRHWSPTRGTATRSIGGPRPRRCLRRTLQGAFCPSRPPPRRVPPASCSLGVRLVIRSRIRCADRRDRIGGRRGRRYAGRRWFCQLWLDRDRPLAGWHREVRRRRPARRRVSAMRCLSADTRRQGRQGGGGRPTFRVRCDQCGGLGGVVLAS